MRRVFQNNQRVRVKSGGSSLRGIISEKLEGTNLFVISTDWGGKVMMPSEKIEADIEVNNDFNRNF